MDRFGCNAVHAEPGKQEVVLGRVDGPRCGSGARFAQSERLLEEHGGRLGDVAVDGQGSGAQPHHRAACPGCASPCAAGFLMMVPTLGLIGPLRDWLPNVLLASLLRLVVGVSPLAYVRPAQVRLAATWVLLWLAAVRLERRES